MHNCELGPKFKWWSISPTSRRICGSVLQRFFSMTFVFVKMEQSNAGIPVNVIKPVPKSEKIVGVGNMTNILDDHGMERRGRIIVGVEGFFGSATAVDKDLGIWVQLCFRDSTTTWWPTFFPFPRWRSRWRILFENYSHFFSHSSFISSVKIKMRNSFGKFHIFINLKCSLPSESEKDSHGFMIYKKKHTRNSFPGSKDLRLDTGEY